MEFAFHEDSYAQALVLVGHPAAPQHRQRARQPLRIGQREPSHHIRREGALEKGHGTHRRHRGAAGSLQHHLGQGDGRHPLQASAQSEGERVALEQEGRQLDNTRLGQRQHTRLPLAENTGGLQQIRKSHSNADPRREGQSVGGAGQKRPPYIDISQLILPQELLPQRIAGQSHYQRLLHRAGNEESVPVQHLGTVGNDRGLLERVQRQDHCRRLLQNGNGGSDRRRLQLLDTSDGVQHPGQSSSFRLSGAVPGSHRSDAHRSLRLQPGRRDDNAGAAVALDDAEDPRAAAEQTLPAPTGSGAQLLGFLEPEHVEPALLGAQRTAARLQVRQAQIPDHEENHRTGIQPRIETGDADSTGRNEQETAALRRRENQNRLQEL